MQPKYKASFIVEKYDGIRDQWYVVIREVGGNEVMRYPVGNSKPKNAYLPHFLNKYMQQEHGAVV